MSNTLEANQRNETELIESAKAGDKDAFGCLFDRYFNKIFQYLRIRSGNTQNAEDLTEIVFLKAWEHLPTFNVKKENVHFQAWLFRIAYNTLIDHYRTSRNDLELNDRIIDKEKSESVETRIIKSEEGIKMMEAIKMLDESSQEVIICRFFSGLSHRDTSHTLGLSEANVRVIQFRALKRLKEFMRDDDVQ